MDLFQGNDLSYEVTSKLILNTNYLKDTSLFRLKKISDQRSLFVVPIR